MYYKREYTDGFFNVSGKHGFLPIKEPLSVLPSKYNELQSVIDKLHVKQDGGILGIPNEIVNAVSLVPNYKELVQEESDTYVLHKILPTKVDPLVSLMKVEKVPDSTYDMVGGLDKQIKEVFFLLISR